MILLDSGSLAECVAMIVPTAVVSEKLLAANVVDKEGASLTLVAVTVNACEVV